MKNICLVNGSLGGKNSASLKFLKDIDHRLPVSESRKTVINVRVKMKDHYPEETMINLAEADAIIFVFPLHNYGLPGALMQLLENYYEYVKQGVKHKASSVYIVVNCGFPRPRETCGEVLRVMQNFCRRLSLKYRFALCIGTGPIVALTSKVSFLYPKLKKAYNEIVSDIQEFNVERKNNYFIKPIIPESIIAFIKRRYEKKGKMIPSGIF